MKTLLKGSFFKKYPAIIVFSISIAMIIVSAISLYSINTLYKLAQKYIEKSYIESIETQSLLLHSFINHFNVFSKFSIEKELSSIIKSINTVNAAFIISATDDDKMFKIIKSIKGAISLQEPYIDTSTNNIARKGFITVTVRTQPIRTNSTLYIESYIPIKVNNKQCILVVQWLLPTLLLLDHQYTTLLRQSSFIIAAIIIIIFIFTAAILFIYSHRTKKLVKELSHSIQHVAMGIYDIHLNEEIDNELKDISISFNTLVQNVKNKDQLLHTIKEQTYSEIFKKGVALLKEMKLDEASACFLVVLLYRPQSFASLCNLGVCYAKKGDMEKALEYFMKAKEINPDNEIVQRYIDKVNALKQLA